MRRRRWNSLQLIARADSQWRRTQLLGRGAPQTSFLHILLIPITFPDSQRRRFVADLNSLRLIGPMKKIVGARLRQLLLLACVLLSVDFSACVQSGEIKDLRPTVILISLDGFRYDYLEKYEPANLRSMARDGVQARWMNPSFPSKTFPNHYTIATGLYPQDHGIVENNVFDKTFNATFTMGNREEVQSSRWWLGEPIWITAEKQGQKTAPFFWLS